MRRVASQGSMVCCALEKEGMGGDGRDWEGMRGNGKRGRDGKRR